MNAKLEKINLAAKLVAGKPVTTCFEGNTFLIAADTIIASTRKLHEFGLHALIDIVAIDYLHYGNTAVKANSEMYPKAAKTMDNNDAKARFALIYQFLSHEHKFRFNLKVFPKNCAIDSITTVYPSANWYEREVFDLFGIKFLGHPNLTKILTEQELVGNPLRKDFHASGNYEVFYDETTKALKRTPYTKDYPNDTPKVIRS